MLVQKILHPLPEFVEIQATAFRSINTDNSDKSLDKGVWYPTDYFDALKKLPDEQAEARAKWVKEKNICCQGYVSLKAFERLEGRQFTFVAKTNLAASSALDQITQGLALLECGTALQLASWIALRDYIGIERFNILLSLPRGQFSPLYLQHGAYILSLLYQEVKIQGEEEILPGDVCYFKNISKYPQRHPFGLSLGYNTVCISANRHTGEHNKTKFMAFGLPLDGSTSSEIESHLFNEFNKEPLKPNDYMSMQQAETYPQSSIKTALTWEEFQKEPSLDHNGMKGRLVLKIRRLRLDRLDELKNTPPDEIGKLISKWHKAI